MSLGYEYLKLSNTKGKPQFSKGIVNDEPYKNGYIWTIFKQAKNAKMGICTHKKIAIYTYFLKTWLYMAINVYI